MPVGSVGALVSVSTGGKRANVSLAEDRASAIITGCDTRVSYVGVVECVSTGETRETVGHVELEANYVNTSDGLLFVGSVIRRATSNTSSLIASGLR